MTIDEITEVAEGARLKPEEIERAYRRRGYGSPHVEVLDPEAVANAQLQAILKAIKEKR